MYLTRIVIETTSPMAINTGGRETGFDSQLARDANNLPYIPATSIAGVWHNIARQYLDKEILKCWFGHTDNPNKEHNSQASVLTLSDGVVLNSNNQAMQGLVATEAINQDEVLSLLVQKRPHHRERVSINDRGVAKDKGKFDQLLLPSGVRFCVDIKFVDSKLINNQIEAQWRSLIKCWQHPLFAFGASTRNGLGKFKIVGVKEHNISLKLKQGEEPTEIVQQLRNFSERKTIPLTVQKNSHLAEKVSYQYLARLELKAIDNWRCGSGSQLLSKINNQKKSEYSVNIISYSEPKIEWDAINNKGVLGQPKAILCGSSIKGILAHRVAFHLRRLNEQWAEKIADEKHDIWQTRPEALKDLFGHADKDEHDKSLAGSLYVEDCELSYEHTSIRQHNSIDRFTGGVRKGALYSEELLYQPSFTINLMLQTGTVLTEKLKQALLDTLNDLKIGLLPMGAGSGRGTSLVQAKDKNKWCLKNIENIPVKEENNEEPDATKQNLQTEQAQGAVL